MSQPFLGEIRAISFSFAPKGWAVCSGQLLPINQNQALFSLLGTTYGGDGRTIFQLPNLQGRMPIHWGSAHSIGETGGEETHTLSIPEMPTHRHVQSAGPVAGSASPAGALQGPGTTPMFAASGSAAMNPTALTSTGGNQAHENRPPFLVLNFVIALTGIFPSRS